MMTDWAATQRCAARVILAEGLAIQGEVHLQPRVAWRDGPETIIELLNREDNFFPLSLPSGEVVFVSKEQVAALTYATPPDGIDPARETSARMIPLEVRMVGGVEYHGIAMSELPPNRARALDLLNAHERFFLLVTSEGSLCLNRRHVRAARPLS